MARKTNKTAHVLDLLTNGEGTDNGESAEVTEAEAKPKKVVKKTVPASAKTVTVVDNASKSDEVANDILKKLTEELDQGEAEPVETEPGSAESLPESEEQSEEQPEVDKTETESAHLSTGDPVSDNQQENNETCGWQTVNVMEAIIQQEDLDTYINQYGVCTCSRCRADVIALILTSMPAKYVVVENNVASPMISFYRSKFKIRLLTEIAKACVIVKNNPRHNLNSQE